MPAADIFNGFEIRDVLHFEDTPSGLVRAAISTPLADAEIYLHGAHVTRWTPRGEQPVLFVSSRSLFEAGKPIRGGVPIVFPWFGPRSAGQAGPIHGYARISEWTVEATKLHEDGRVEIALTLAPHLRFRVTFGRELEMELETRNEGSEPFTYEEALHTYFAIGDIHRVSISGLAGTTYIDKTDGFQRKTLGSEPLRIARETDQVHLNAEAACTIDDPAGNRRIVVEKTGSGTTVVWNPWIDKARAMADMADGEWREMLCVETANAADNAICLAPGQTNRLTARIRLA